MHISIYYGWCVYVQLYFNPLLRLSADLNGSVKITQVVSGSMFSSLYNQYISIHILSSEYWISVWSLGHIRSLNCCNLYFRATVLFRSGESLTLCVLTLPPLLCRVFNNITLYPETTSEIFFTWSELLHVELDKNYFDQSLWKQSMCY